MCSCHALSHSLYPWNSNPLNLMCSISIFLLHDWINYNIWTASCTKLSYNLNFQQGGQRTCRYFEIHLKYHSVCGIDKNRRPNFGSCFQFRAPPALGNNRRKRLSPLFWKLIALKKEAFQSSGPRLRWPSALPSSVWAGAPLAPVVPALGTSWVYSTFSFPLSWRVLTWNSFYVTWLTDVFCRVLPLSFETWI